MPYQIPIDFGALLRNQKLPTVSLRASIQQRIYLILLTNKGEWRYDEDFHCLLWEKDFEQTDNLNLWLDEVKDDIKNSVHTYETRLSIRQVTVEKDELQEKNRENKVTRIRNRLNITVKGTIKETEEAFDETFLMFFGPITVI